MEIETNRLKSYNKAYHRNQHKLNVEDLSHAGFYALDTRTDNVRCAYCDLQLRDWKENDNAHKLHLQYNPQCPYAKVVCGVQVDALTYDGKDSGRDRLNYYDEEPLHAGRVPRTRNMITARKETYNKCVRPLSVSVHRVGGRCE